MYFLLSQLWVLWGQMNFETQSSTETDASQYCVIGLFIFIELDFEWLAGSLLKNVCLCVFVRTCLDVFLYVCVCVKTVYQPLWCVCVCMRLGVLLFHGTLMDHINHCRCVVPYCNTSVGVYFSSTRSSLFPSFFHNAFQEVRGNLYIFLSQIPAKSKWSKAGL